jgi:hypothetical protein
LDKMYIEKYKELEKRGAISRWFVPSRRLKARTIEIWKTKHHFLISVKQVEASKQYKNYDPKSAIFYWINAEQYKNYDKKFVYFRVGGNFMNDRTT